MWWTLAHITSFDGHCCLFCMCFCFSLFLTSCASVLQCTRATAKIMCQWDSKCSFLASNDIWRVGYCSGGSHEPLTTEVLQKTWLLVAWRTDILSKIAVGNCGVVYNRKPCSANCHCGKRSIQYMGQEQRLPDAVALPPNSVLSCTGSLCVYGTECLCELLCVLAFIDWHCVGQGCGSREWSFLYFFTLLNTKFVLRALSARNAQIACSTMPKVIFFQ